MAEDNIVCFQNPRQPLLVKSGVTRHWLNNLSDRKLNYTIRLESADSCFSVDAGQVSGEIEANGHISLIITRKPGVGKEDKLIVEYTGDLKGKTVQRLVPIS